MENSTKDSQKTMESITKENQNSSESKIVYKTISGGLIPSITKSVVQNGIFWIIVYILGLYNFNWKVSSFNDRNCRFSYVISIIN